MRKYEFLEHTADIKFQAFGRTLEEVFANSALAMTNAMYDGKVKEKIKRKIKVKGKDFEGLLYNFLEELLILLDSRNFFLSKIKKIKINKKGKEKILEAEVFGDYAKNYKICLDVKAVTYNQMFVKQEKGKWVTQVVLDV
jgi:SHS2 domain-containing protein